jgi:hypothetical protein
VTITASDTVAELDDADFGLYAGFYQGLAWAQGATDGPLKFSWPDEMMRRGWHEPMPFSRIVFYAVAAYLDDEGQIHYWDNEAATLYCTEDRTPSDIPDTAHTSYTQYQLLTDKGNK